MTRSFKEPEPDLFVDLWLYPSDAGGKAGPILSGYGCLCMVSAAEPLQGWEVRLVFADGPFVPGQRRRIGVAFLSEEGARAARAARNLFLWEGRLVGEGQVCDGVAKGPAQRNR